MVKLIPSKKMCFIFCQFLLRILVLMLVILVFGLKTLAAWVKCNYANGFFNVLRNIGISIGVSIIASLHSILCGSCPQDWCQRKSVNTKSAHMTYSSACFHLTSVCRLSVCLSRTSGLSREQRAVVTAVLLFL